MLARLNDTVDISALAPTAANAVLMYHSVGSGTGNADERTLSVPAFRAQMRELTDQFDVVDLPAVLERGDRRRVAVTFDDGFENVYTNALPVLREFDVPATCFLITDRIGGSTADGEAYMSASQVRELIASDLVTIGTHTHSHPWLSGVTDEATLRAEIEGAKTELEAQFDVDIDRFCYPYSDVTPEALALVRETHSYATATNGLVPESADPHLIPRIDGSEPLSVVRWNLTGIADWLRRRVVGASPPIDDR
ncbi:polysaccharide deacetylase family protein [Haloarcula sp. CBA1130]|nr:polysaccharide deacetylase family protein [Haloarcula sp. CBA1130]